MSVRSIKKECDECGKYMPKAHRVESHRRYCITCYSRLFESRPCPKCAVPRRLLKNDPNAVCRQCAKSVPCTRCGKVAYRIGKITPFGPACNSCSVYFRAPKLIDMQVSGNGDSDVLVSSGTTTIANHGTCQDCRRYRRLFLSSDARKLCRVCLHIGKVPCPSCGNEMPAGRGNSCESCYWAATFRKRLQIDEAGLTGKVFVQLFREFGSWLQVKVPPKKAALTIHDYFSFFFEMEKQWSQVPTYPELLKHFTAEGLRRVRLPMRWLADTQRVIVNAAERENASECRRITAILNSLPVNSVAAQVLTQYHDDLQRKVEIGQISIRTMRLSLRPAASLLAASCEENFQIPSQGALDNFLLNAPGQKAAITGFISFLNKRNSTRLVARVEHQRVHKKRQLELERELIVFLQNELRDEHFKKKWFSIALAYFHGLSRKVGEDIKEDAISCQGEDGFSISWSGNTYWIPHWHVHPS